MLLTTFHKFIDCKRSIITFYSECIKNVSENFQENFKAKQVKFIGY